MTTMTTMATVSRVFKIGGPLLLAVGLGWWIWFLATKPLAEADSWSSIAAGLAALIGLAGSLFSYRRPTRQRRTVCTGTIGRTGQVNLGDRNLPAGARPDDEKRNATITGDVHGTIDLGDHHQP